MMIMGCMTSSSNAQPGRRAPAPLGNLLRHWRHSRGRSQLDLALLLGVSPRHLSFIETGRSTPSREMVLHLADGLDVPLRERNALLLAAGYAPVYREASLEDHELAPVRRAISAMLRQHEPYPAVVLDRRWDLIEANDAAKTFFSFLLDGRAPIGRPNILRSMFDPTLVRPHVVEWDTVAESLIRRLHREAPGGEPDASLAAELMALPGVRERWSVRWLDAPVLPIIPVTFEKAGRRFAYFSMVTTVGTAQDITLQELRIESFFPLDAATDAAARGLAGGQ